MKPRLIAQTNPFPFAALPLATLLLASAAEMKQLLAESRDRGFTRPGAGN